MLISGLPLRHEMAASFSIAMQRRMPFAVAAIENRDDIAITKAHHIQQVMLLIAAGEQRLACGEIVGDEKPGLGRGCVHLPHVSRRAVLCKPGKAPAAWLAARLYHRRKTGYT